MQYKKIRVRTPVRTFRDLEVYQQAIKLSADVFNLKLPAKFKDPAICGEVDKLKEISKIVPKMIVESYDDKFSNFSLAEKKLEKAIKAINLIIAKLDFLNAFVEDEKWREELLGILKRYERVKIRTLNLKKAWTRVFKK